MRVEELQTYELLEKREMKDIGSTGYLMRHKKTGAKVALLSNQDENKVFYIGFRTPPKNSTGVAHILEHSVLCGSRDFPIKDPFVELVKGSLNTFLNAMTYPDKTLYPVASCNDKDFQNLMHVYLDAVFYPNIYQNPSIFGQEGWHYEMETPGDALKINGVVYNEMKGAFSSPDDVLEREIMNTLYPDTEYGVESGGDPQVIPQLSYEEFLAFHKQYYHPSNSYIYLYGDMDMAEKLAYIDREYLSAFDAISVDSSLRVQPAFDKPRRHVKEYPITDGEDEEENTFLSLNFSVKDTLDPQLYVAMDILDYALCSAPGAPLKQALLDGQIGKDVYSICEMGIKQPYFSIIAKDTSLEKEEAFIHTVRETLKNLAQNGMDKKSLLAGINYYEFKYREADFDSYPKGLMYGLQMLDSWLYDETKPFLHLEANETFARLRECVEEGYFEQLIRTYLLENTHCSIVILKPETGLLEKQEKALAKELAEKKAQMSKEEIAQVIEDFRKLRAFQEKEDAKEDLEKIPLLRREDLKKEALVLENEEKKIGDTLLLYHEIPTNGIAYLRLIFDTKDIPEAYFPYLGILKGCLGVMNTEHYQYGDLFNQINLVTGGMVPVYNVYTDHADPERCKVTFDIKTKVLYPHIGEAVLLMQEMMLTTVFADEKRLYEIIAEGKSRLQSQMMSAGHSLAAVRALSYASVSAGYHEQLSGIDFYRMIAHLEEQFETEKADLIEKLKALVKMLFRPENLMVDLTADKEALPAVEKAVEALKTKLFTEEVEKGRYLPKTVKKNEGFMNSAQVQYVCRAGNFRRKGLAYTGSLRVLKVILGYEYLWVNVRVKGGAYGCMCSFGLSGDSYFVSYRDPNLAGTIEVYQKAADTVAGFDADERTMTQFIIGAVSDMDAPLTPSAKGLQALSAYLSGYTQAQRQLWRDQVLQATPEDIRKLADYIRAFMEDEQLCVVGNSGKIKEEEKIFGKLENLF